MTNNLKAGQTLTAEELQAIIDGCEGVTPGPWFMYGEPEVGLSPEPFSGSIGKGDMEPVYRWGPNLHHIARLDPDTVKAMASMALQSLSTQQPMGEVRVKPLEWRHDSGNPYLWHVESPCSIFYRIHKSISSENYQIIIQPDGCLAPFFPSLEAAQGWCGEEHSRRINSCMENS